jgi:hypothetical protein
LQAVTAAVMGMDAFVMKFEALAKLEGLGHSWPEPVDGVQECPSYGGPFNLFRSDADGSGETCCRGEGEGVNPASPAMERPHRDAARRVGDRG